MGFTKRDAYERELIQIISDKHRRLYGQRGTHSDGIDVLFFIGSSNQEWTYSIRCEVKTALNTPLYFSQKLLLQYKRYMEILQNYRVMTFYCFRTMTKKKVITQKNRKGEIINSIELRDGYPEDKWRIFKVDEVPQNNRGTPFLDFFHKDGMTIEKFISRFEKLMDD